MAAMPRKVDVLKVGQAVIFFLQEVTLHNLLFHGVSALQQGCKFLALLTLVM